MNDFLQIYAKIYLVLLIGLTILRPSIFGKERSPYTFWAWLFDLPFSILLGLVLLSFIGAI